MAWLNGSSLLHAQSVGEKYEELFDILLRMMTVKPMSGSEFKFYWFPCDQPLKCDPRQPADSMMQ
jgi:hypothetical protein